MEPEIRFAPDELTGRSRTHIVDLTEPVCSLHRAVVEPFRALRSAARVEGIDLVPLSSFRDFDRQLAIWNGKYRGERELRGTDGALLDALSLDDDARVEAILHWSALPGASRHHWGTDFDAIDAAAMPAGYRPCLEPAEYAAGGVFEKLGRWLDGHAAAHGFYRPYASWRGGVQPEPWHLSHARVANAALAQFSPALLAAALEHSGIEAAAVIRRRMPEIFERYVRNVDRFDEPAAIRATRPA